MSGKGDRDRTTDQDAYGKAYDRIFNGTFNGGKNINQGVLNGGNTDSTKVSPLSDVGATPTSSTKLIPDKPSTKDDTPSGIKLQATRHDIMRIIV